MTSRDNRTKKKLTIKPERLVKLIRREKKTRG